MRVDLARVVAASQGARYSPALGAPLRGEWDRSGEFPVWVQDHRSLVADALSSWKGATSDMEAHFHDSRRGVPLPTSGSGKVLRARADALLWELEHAARSSPRPLYRGSHRRPSGVAPWSESRAVAEAWARKGAGVVYGVPKGTRGLRVADYLGSDPEREWLVDADAAHPTALDLNLPA